MQNMLLRIKQMKSYLKILLVMTAILLFVITCSNKTAPITDATGVDALSTRAGYYANDDLMLDISSTGDVNFSNTGDFKDAEKVVTKKVDNADTTFTFNYKTIDYTLKFGEINIITLNSTQLIKTTKPLSLAARVGIYTDKSNESIFVAVADTGNIWPVNLNNPTDGKGIYFSTNSTKIKFIINNTTTVTFNSLTSLTYIDTSNNINAECVK